MIFKKKTEIGREPVEIPFDRLVESLGRYAVENRQVGIKDNAFTARYGDSRKKLTRDRR